MRENDETREELAKNIHSLADMIKSASEKMVSYSSIRASVASEMGKLSEFNDQLSDLQEYVRYVKRI